MEKMNNVLRGFLRSFHPQGIPQLGSYLYNKISRTQIFQKHYDLVAREVTHYCHRGKLLDIGTGPGWFLLYLNQIVPQMEIHGIDISPAMVGKAKINIASSGQHKNIVVRVASSSQLPYPDNSFDVVVSTGSIHHWKEPQQGLIEIYRVLKSDRYALIYDLVQKIPESISKKIKHEFGRFRFTLLCFHSFEEPFYSIAEMKLLPVSTPFKRGEIHFTGALCCLVLKKTKRQRATTENIVTPRTQFTTSSLHGGYESKMIIC